MAPAGEGGEAPFADVWPSGQRRQPLRDRINFSPNQVRAGRALMGLTVAALANLSGRWPLDVFVKPEQLEAFEAGRADALSELQHAAICHALYHEGFGVVALAEAGAGEGVRFALPASHRAEGTYSERRWRPVFEAYKRRAAEIQAHDRRMRDLHGDQWWMRMDLPLVPAAGGPSQTIEPVPGGASHAP